MAFYRCMSKGSADPGYGTNIDLCVDPIYASDSNDVPALKLNGRTISMRYNSNTLMFVCTKDDGVTESTINVQSAVGAAYHETFRIIKAHYLNSNQAVIVYDYGNANGTAPRQCRLITCKYDGTLQQSGAITLTSTATTSLWVDAYLMPCYYDRSSFLVIRKEINTSTGATVIYSNRILTNLTAGSLTLANTTWATPATANVQSYAPAKDYMSIMGGITFNANNGNAKIYMLPNYDGTIKNLVLSSTYSDNYELLVNGSDSWKREDNLPPVSISSEDSCKRQFIVGISEDGYLITVTKAITATSSTSFRRSLVANFWQYDPITSYYKRMNSGTVQLHSDTVTDTSSDRYKNQIENYNLLSYRNGIFIIQTEINAAIGVKVSNVQQASKVADYMVSRRGFKSNLTGYNVFSDPFNGVFIY